MRPTPEQIAFIEQRLSSLISRNSIEPQVSAEFGVSRSESRKLVAWVYRTWQQLEHRGRMERVATYRHALERLVQSAWGAGRYEAAIRGVRTLLELDGAMRATPLQVNIGGQHVHGVLAVAQPEISSEDWLARHSLQVPRNGSNGHSGHSNGKNGSSGKPPPPGGN